ncbi:MAG: DUF3592 domain-containing protein [Actinopolymorphaceae bacterium]
MNGLGIFALAWSVLSAVFLYRGCAFVWNERQFDRTCVTTSGEVVGEERKIRTVSSTSGGRRTMSYSYPVIAFRTNDGRELRSTTKVNVAHPYPVGTAVDIEYLPEDPRRIRVIGDSVARWAPVLVVTAGAAFLLLGLVLLVVAFR